MYKGESKTEKGGVFKLFITLFLMQGHANLGCYVFCPFLFIRLCQKCNVPCSKITVVMFTLLYFVWIF